MTQVSRKLILPLVFFAAILIYSSTALANQLCAATRFVIEDEATGIEIGLIYTDTTTARGAHESACLEGSFAGRKYQYLYTCDSTGNFKFIKKFKVNQKGCKWGIIH